MSETMSSSSSSRSRKPRRDLISRIHTGTLEPPDTLLGALNISNSQIQEVSSSSDSDFQQPKSSQSLPRHARSLSNPFPSFLSTSKKRQGSIGQSHLDPERGDGANTMAGPSIARSRTRSPTGSKDFTTGNCMTCGSLMRWPKGLTVFKCTICTTVNDLVISGKEPSKSGILGRRRGSTSHASSDNISCTKILLQTPPKLRNALLNHGAMQVSPFLFLTVGEL